MHPPWLHRFTFAPWLIQAPPLTAPLVASSLHFCIMAHTNSSFFGVIGAPNVAASLHLCTMADINPSHLGVVGASIEGADMSVFFRCPGAIIFFTLIFHDRLGFLPTLTRRDCFWPGDSRLVGAAYANGRGVVGLSATTTAAALAVRLCLSPCRGE